MQLMKEKEVRDRLLKDLGVIKTKSRIFQIAYRINAVKIEKYIDKFDNVVKKVYIDYDKIKEYYEKRIGSDNNNEFLPISKIAEKYNISKDVVYYIIRKYNFTNIKKDIFYERILINEQEWKKIYQIFNKSYYKRKDMDSEG